MAATVIECVRCGCERLVSGRGRPAQFCSDRCRIAYARATQTILRQAVVDNSMMTILASEAWRLARLGEITHHDALALIVAPTPRILEALAARRECEAA